MSKVGKYILGHWVNGDYESRTLKRVTRETKRYYICNRHRDTDYSDPNGDHKYYFQQKYSDRYRKTNDELGLGRYITRRSNLDGTLHLSWVDDPSTVKCVCTFDELFNTDLRTFQHPNNWPLRAKLREYERDKARGFKSEEDIFKIRLDEMSGMDKGIDGWDNKIILHLKKLFKVDKVYHSILDNIREHSNKSKLTKSATKYRINELSGDKKYVTFEERYFDRTIYFWLFDDCLVFSYIESDD